MNIESKGNIEEIKETLKVENRTNPILVDYYGDGKNVSVMHVAASLSDNKAQYTKIHLNESVIRKEKTKINLEIKGSTLFL